MVYLAWEGKDKALSHDGKQTDLRLNIYNNHHVIRKGIQDLL